MTAILNAAEMLAAEQRAIDAGTPVETLMERAGMAAAEAIWRFAGPLPALIFCGPGNNGGDGYVIARGLSERGVKVRVAASAEPTSPAAIAARRLWNGPVEPMDAKGAPLLVDALFGTGLTRALDDLLARALAQPAVARIAIDLPSGVATDDGAILSPVPDYDATIALGALKPSHLLQPAARHMGRIVVADIGVETKSALNRIERPRLAAPGPDDHKYTRGLVAVLAGDMTGAAALASVAAARSGAGYVRLVSSGPVRDIPHAIVQSGDPGDILSDPRVGSVVIGPGLGRGAASKDLFGQALVCDRPLILDADALHLIEDPGSLRAARHMPILTPHSGEFARLFETAGSKVNQARRAAQASGAVIVFKGADTVVAHPDGRVAIARPASPWLATAGTGDVLAGVIAAIRSRGCDPFDAACAGIWLHGRAGELAGPGLVADDLPEALSAALAECL